VKHKIRRDFISIAMVSVALLTVPVFFRGYTLDFLTMTAIWIIFATSLWPLSSLGLISFGHAGFMAIGGYASALLTMNAHISFWLALPLSGVIAGIIALMIGYPLIRMKGAYFFLSSLAFGSIVVLIFHTQYRDIFHGSMGIPGIPYPSSAFTSSIPYYYLNLGLVAITIGIIFRLKQSRIGLEWESIREADDLSASVGINIIKSKIIAFVIACFFAGIAGSSYAHYVRFIAPESFDISIMLTCLIYVIVGGMNSVWGPPIGVLTLRGIGLWLGGLKEWELMLYSVILILFITLLPGGLVSIPQRIRKSQKRLTDTREA
jgi:branched-chain amino acid transport system permease protein